MKGILFNLLEELVIDEHGFDVWDQMIEATGVSGAYTAVGSYDDDDLTSLVSSLGDLCSAGDHGVDDPTVMRWFGSSAMAPLAEKYPAFFAPHERTVDFILTLNEVIHAEVLKLHPDAVVPTFQFTGVDRGETDSVTLHYTSQRRMCALVEGFAAGAARHFDESTDVRHVECMLDGADECRLECRFTPLVPSENTMT